MKLIKKSLLTLVVGISITLPAISKAAQNCPTCGGYFYTAVAQMNNNGIISYQYASRGPYTTEEECLQATYEDYANNDSWLPFEGSPKCVYRFETDYEAYEEILDFWNTTAPPSGSGAGSMNNEELIKKIKILRQDYSIRSYNHKLEAMITDPEMDD